jgi:hypothetical protein
MEYRPFPETDISSAGWETPHSIGKQSVIGLDSSQKPASCSCPQLDESSLWHPNLFLLDSF